jgi:hypothetical protein
MLAASASTSRYVTEPNNIVITLPQFLNPCAVGDVSTMFHTTSTSLRHYDLIFCIVELGYISLWRDKNQIMGIFFKRSAPM